MWRKGNSILKFHFKDEPWDLSLGVFNFNLANGSGNQHPRKWSSTCLLSELSIMTANSFCFLVQWTLSQWMCLKQTANHLKMSICTSKECYTYTGLVIQMPGRQLPDAEHLPCRLAGHWPFVESWRRISLILCLLHITALRSFWHRRGVLVHNCCDSSKYSK